MKETQATPDEQQAYEQALQAASEILYRGDDTHEGVLKMLRAGEPVDSLVKTSLFVLTQLDQKLNLPEAVLLQLLTTLFDLLQEIAAKANLFTLTPQQEKTGLAAAQQALLQVYGVGEEDLTGLTEGMTEADVADVSQTYDEVTNAEWNVPTGPAGGGEERLGDNGGEVGGGAPASPPAV
jgi:hypothetical protein